MYALTPKRIVVYDEKINVAGLFEGGYNPTVFASRNFIYNGTIRDSHFVPIKTKWGFYFKNDNALYFLPPEKVSVLSTSRGFLVLPNNPVGKLIEESMVESGKIDDGFDVPVKILYSSMGTLFLEDESYIFVITKNSAKIYPREFVVDKVWKASHEDVINYLKTGSENFRRTVNVTMTGMPYILSRMYKEIKPTVFTNDFDRLEMYLASDEAYSLIEGDVGGKHTLSYRDFWLSMSPVKYETGKLFATVDVDDRTYKMIFVSKNCYGKSAAGLFMSCLWNNPYVYAELSGRINGRRIYDGGATIGVGEDFFGSYSAYMDNCRCEGVRVPTTEGVVELTCKKIEDNCVYGVFRDGELNREIFSIPVNHVLNVTYSSKYLLDRKFVFTSSTKRLVNKALSGEVDVEIDRKAEFQILLNKGRVENPVIIDKIVSFIEFETV